MSDMHRGLIFSREKVRQVDRAAVETYRMPSIVLMENASRQAADVAMEMLDPPAAKRRVLVLCGGGNNGGDGLAAARHLHNRGVDVHIVLMKPPDAYDGDAGVNLAICRAMDLPISEAADRPIETLRHVEPADLIVDSLLGTGLDSAVRSPMDEVIGWVNAVKREGARVLAVDIPSGLDCDRGEPLGAAVEATATITFVGNKRGFIQPGAERYTGRVVVGDIGAPHELVEELGEPVGD